MNTFPKPVTMQINETRYWEGLGRQEMDFHQVLSELIDNSISAAGKDAAGDLQPFNIEITIERLGNKVMVKIADDGIGMGHKELTENIFSPGAKGHSNGPLNEHGFGFKNALCMLTAGNKHRWYIQSRDEEAEKENLYLRVNGPFSSTMQVELDSPSEWVNNLEYCKKNVGTRVYAETSLDFFNTVYKRAKKFEALVDALIEHLGIIYRGYLLEHHNKLWIRYRNLGDDVTNYNGATMWISKRILPIEISYADTSQSSVIKLSGDEGEVEVTYTRGLLDKTKVNQKISDFLPEGLKIYYQGNRQTAGIDIVINGRILKSGYWLDEWPERHNDFNTFVGELSITGKAFKTVNNKISLDPHNTYWIQLKEKLNGEDFRPQKVTKSKVEKDIKIRLKKSLEGLFSGSKATMHRVIFSGSGVEVDMYHELQSGDTNVYEVKAGSAAPLDVYQLLMYWDGVVRDDKKSPTLGRLVAKEISDAVKNIASEINKRKDSLGNSYNLEMKTIEEMGL